MLYICSKIVHFLKNYIYLFIYSTSFEITHMGNGHPFRVMNVPEIYPSLKLYIYFFKYTIMCILYLAHQQPGHREGLHFELIVRLVLMCPQR